VSSRQPEQSIGISALRERRRRGRLIQRRSGRSQVVAVVGPGLGDGGNGCLLSVRLSIRKISAAFQSMSVTGARVQQPPGSVDGVTRGGSTQICYTVKWQRTCTESICRCIAFISFTTLPLPFRGVLAMALCLSVCPTVTSRSSTKTAKYRIIQTTLHDSSGTLVF